MTERVWTVEIKPDIKRWRLVREGSLVGYIVGDSGDMWFECAGESGYIRFNEGTLLEIVNAIKSIQQEES